MLSGGCRCIKGTTECLDFMFLILNKLNFGCRSHLLPYYYYFYFYYFYSFPLDSVKYYSQQFYHAVELILKWMYVKKLNILNSSCNPVPQRFSCCSYKGWNGQNLLSRWRCWISEIFSCKLHSRDVIPPAETWAPNEIWNPYRQIRCSSNRGI